MQNNAQLSFSQTAAQMEATAKAISSLQDKIYAITDRLVEEYGSQLEAAESALNGYLFTNKWGAIKDANVTAANYLGIKNYQFLIGTPLLVYVAQPSHKAFMNQLHQLRQSPTNSAWVLTLQHKQGWTFPVEVSISQVRDAQNHLVGWHWQLQDLVRVEEPSMPLKKFEPNRLPKLLRQAV